jgi:hypothetical protein
LFLFSEDNIVLHKPAWQLHQFNPGDYRFDASNASDGLKYDLHVWSGQCTISAGNQQIATWRVDLEDIRSIHYITLYYRTENQPWGKLL